MAMTTARELHDEWPLMNANERAFLSHEDCKTILRALDLLARTEEESSEDIVQRLKLHGWLTAANAIETLKAERDRLKTHAEAMAMTLENLREERPGCIASLDDYRRDFRRVPV